MHNTIKEQAFKEIIEMFTLIDQIMYELSQQDSSTLQYNLWIEKSYSSLQVQDLNRITKLDLSGIAITDLPSEFGFLSTLKFLDLSGNCLTHIPKCIWNLNNLKELQFGSLIFGGNNIQEIPSEIKNLKNLEFLDIRFNDKLQTLPAEILELEKLCLIRMTQEELYGSDIVQKLINEKNCNVILEEKLPSF